MYVRSLFETDDGTFVCLVQYDRAGAAFGEWVDILSNASLEGNNVLQAEAKGRRKGIRA